MDQPYQLIIRNMVCDRCRTAVERILTLHGITWVRVELGEVELARPLSERSLKAFREDLVKQGFDLVDDRTAQLIVRVKNLIIGVIRNSGMAVPRTKLSAILSESLSKEYSGIASAFSQIEGITIEQYFLLQRIERVKELIRYGDHTMSEIADQTGFSSVAHLSTQFKKLTGMTPTAFRELRAGRTSLDHV